MFRPSLGRHLKARVVTGAVLAVVAGAVTVALAPSMVDGSHSGAQATALFEYGQGAATRFLAEWDWEGYLATFRE